jgi:Skp family chaperone for outer membrane proteins
MRRMTIAVAVSALMVAGSAYAQTAPPKTPPPTQTPPPATQKPAAPLPMPSPTPAPVPFPEGAKVAFIDLQRVVAESLLGKDGQTAMKALNDKLSSALAGKNKEILALQEKIKTQQNVVSDAVLLSMGRDLEKMQREAQFMQQDSQVQIDQLNQELLKSFQEKVLPVVEKLRDERGLWIIFALGDNSNIAAAHAGLDLSAEIVKRMDAAYTKK